MKKKGYPGGKAGIAFVTVRCGRFEQFQESGNRFSVRNCDKTRS
jgi:hypothetical protein